MTMLARSLTTLALLLVLVPAASARPREVGMTPLEQAREESPAARKALRSSVVGPAGAFFAKPAEYVAAAGSDITFALDPSGAPGGSLEVELPAVFVREVPSGLDTIGTPRASGGAKLSRSGRTLTLDLSGVRAGQVAELVIPDRGIPAGTHALAVSHVSDAGARSSLGSVSVRLYAPVREASAEPSGWEALRAVNVTNDNSTESETFITVVPGDPSRVLAGANGGGGYNAWLSTDGGTTYTKKTVPAALDVPTGDTTTPQIMCCDPMSAANREGDIWYGGLSFNNAQTSGFIIVNRIAAGETSFRPTTVAIPRRKYNGSAGIQDKPMMTIDNAATSPTFGRLYVTWGEPGANGGVNIVISQCDTRPGGGALDAARCDEADNWTPPVDITKSEGGYIYTDVAVGPNGVAYAVWWDYSSTNAIRGATCDPAVVSCATNAGWTAAKTIATLDRSGNTPIPFACPILAQPGGRAAPDPQVETDISAADSRGRVYVTWGDLRADSGTTRCTGAGTPQLTHDSWDSFVAVAPNALPGSAAASTAVGTRLLTDGEGGGQASSDDWFPWLAVDQTTGQAYSAFYSTRDDSTRKSTHFYMRLVSPDGAVGTLQKLSTLPSDYSGNTCCQFGNDYGDYTAIDATCASAFPIWSDKSTADGEAFVQRVDPASAVPCLVLKDATVTEVAGLSDGDGAVEPGETVDVLPTLRNAGSAAAEPSSATLSTVGQALVVDGDAAFPAVPQGSTVAADSPFRVRVDRAAGCTSVIELRSTVVGGAYSAKNSVPLRVQGPAGVCRVAPRAALTASTAAAQTGQAIVFDSGGTTDLDGSIVRYDWDFDGNGTDDQTTTAPSTSTSYAAPGARTIRVRAVDDEGDTSDASVAVTVTGLPVVTPVAPTIRLTDAGKKKKADKKRRVKLALVTCARCTGTLAVQTSGKVRKGKKKVLVKLGTVKFTAGADGKATATIVLSKTNYSLFRKLKKVKLSAALTAVSPEKLTGKASATFTIVK